MVYLLAFDIANRRNPAQPNEVKARPEFRPTKSKTPTTARSSCNEPNDSAGVKVPLATGDRLESVRSPHDRRE